MKLLILFSTLCTFLRVSDAGKVLAIFPAPSYSHFIIGDVLTKELARRGHEVTVIGPFKPKAPIKNYKFIELVGVKEFMAEHKKEVNFYELQHLNKLQMALIQVQFGYEITRVFFENEDVQKLIKSKDTYDLIIMEHFLNEAVYGFCDLFKAPCIALSAVGSMNMVNRLTGNIGLASYIPEPFAAYSPQMSFFERLHNFALMVFDEILFFGYTLPKMEKLLRQHIPTAPPLQDLMSNVSMVFLNSHPALTAPVPLTPNMIELGGVHLQGLKDVTLSSDLQLFLDDHDEGVIYFALGSNAKSKDMPKGTLQEITKAFKKWGKPILWKYEEELPEKIHNVKVAKWFPQTAILAHKNVVGFITHCGRLSSLESLYYGVPMIGLPIFAEQAHNAAEMAYYGYAIALDLQTLKGEDLYNALVEITTASKYSKEAKLRSKVMQKLNALDEAVYWIEHVMEFKGASYLKNAGLNLPWYQFWMVDVIGFSVICFLGFSSVMIYLILKAFNRRSKTNKGTKDATKHKKRN